MAVKIEYEPGELERASEIIDENALVLAVPEGKTQSLSFKVIDRAKANWFLMTLLYDKSGEVGLEQCGIQVTEVHFGDRSQTNLREMAAEIIDVVNRHTVSSYQLIT